MVWTQWEIGNVSGRERYQAIFLLGDVGAAGQHRDELNAVSVPVCRSVSLSH